MNKTELTNVPDNSTENPFAFDSRKSNIEEELGE